ncbi:MAG: GDSL-type esterase/lipase family protein [Bacteroidota bacterium]|nr:GDSL-type esterase/lipase family protein [Bacteroidia bacterium]
MPKYLTGSKKINLYSDIIHKENKKEKPQSLAIVNDSVFFKNDTVKQVLTDTAKSTATKINYKSGELDLTRFFEALHNHENENGKIRIAWFGDSMIEGDLVTQDFRKLMQKIYGGSGVGFVPVTSPVAQFRQTIRQTFSDDWEVYSFMKKPKQNYKLGIGGYSFVSSKGSWVDYKASRFYPVYSEVKMICRQCPPKSFILNEDTSLVFPVDSIGSFKEVELIRNNPIKEVKLTFKKPNCEVHGLYFDKGNGVYVDNFSFRGNSGIPLSNIPFGELKSLGAKENYKLIILSYGLNVVAHDVKNYSWYASSFQKTLNYIKEAFPDASILVMSVGDKSYRAEDGYETEPDIPIFVELQKRIAQRSDVAFYNLYEAMGGYNSMVSWAEGNPQLANLDYTHPNFAGGRKIAGMLYDDIIKSYDRYSKTVETMEVKRDTMIKPQAKQ